MLTRSIFAAALLASTCSNSSFAQNLLANPGFEDGLTFEGEEFVGSWEGFSSLLDTFVGNSFNEPRNGVQHLELRINGRDNAFSGVFQDVPVTVGTEYVFGGWQKTPSTPFDVAVEMRIEWVNASGSVFLRTPNLTTKPTDSYASVSLSGFAPPGAEFARLVYAIGSFGPELTNTGTVFVDDMFFSVVPEPSSLGLFGFTALALGRRSVLRRR
jgi:hypothetical protein